MNKDVIKEVVGNNDSQIARRTVLALLVGAVAWVSLDKLFKEDAETSTNSAGSGQSPQSPNTPAVNVGIPVIPLEEHAKLGEQGLPIREEEQKRLIALTQEILRNINQNPPAIRAEEALKILKGTDGEKALKARAEKYIYFPNLDAYFDIDKFPILAAIYTRGGKDITKEVYKQYPIKGIDGRPVFLPSYFGDQLMEAGDEAKVPPQIAWGVRDETLRALMWARTVDKYKKRYPDKTPVEWEAMAKKEAAPPKVRGFGHLWAADIDNWDNPHLKKAMIKRDFIGGCTGILGEDRRHWSWVLDEQDSFLKKASCEGGQIITKMRQKVRRWVKKRKRHK